MLQILLPLVLMLQAVLAEDPLVVTTSEGKLRGYKLTSRDGRSFLAFSGVPYAKPPLGPLRFQPPQEPQTWTDVRNATVPGPYCLQFSTFSEQTAYGSEDCLYLSVYTRSTRGRIAVLVHFHGGGFSIGNGQLWTEPHYMMDQDVVVVSVNYRLNYFGFLSFEDKEMPGNQGLKDQVMALRWIRKNIAKFGGDPNKVTIMGDSAGGVSVYHHTVSPLSRGLFHRGIAESGTSYIPFSLAPPGFAKHTSQQLARNLGCPTDRTSAAVACLRSKKGEDIAARILDVVIWHIDMDVIWPCLEPDGIGAFLTGPVSRWQHQPVPMIIGQTSAEGLLRTDYFIKNKTDMNWLNDNFDRLAPMLLMYNATASNRPEVTKKVRQFYFPGGDITESWFKLTQMFTDSWFTVGVIDGANNHTGDVYFYYFDYVGEYTFEKGANRTIYFGAPHIEEVNYLWQWPLSTWGPLKEDDLKLSKRLVKIWTDFAKYGKPNPRGSGLSWNKWSPHRHNYLHISNAGIEQKEGFAVDRYKFWKSINYRDNIK